MKLRLILFFFISTLSYSQEFTITGKIVNEENNPLESATIYTEKVSDSSLVTYTVSEKDGSFELRGNTDAINVNFLVSYAGYMPTKQLVVLKPEIDLGTIKMQIMDNTLGEIEIIADRAPLTIKKDTLEFNANAFDTRQDANLEDLMKKLPGVEVDSQGNITVNGRPVSRILVNGEEFFGNDPKIATKNLPKEIIDKIQVTDTKTRSEEFTGKAGNPDDKTINIQLKEDKNKGYFARATAGGGTDDRYELSGIGNYFKDDLRLSVLASSNNINSSGFSFDEVFDMMGRNAGGNVFGGNGGGITKAETAGVNYTNEWENGMEMNADYFFGRNDTETRTIIERENILPDSSYFSNSTNRSNLQNDTHRANFRYEIEFDTLTRVSISPRINGNFGNSNTFRFQETLDEELNLQNSTETSESGDFTNIDFSNRMDFIKRFGNRGSYLRMDLNHSFRNSENNNYLFSEIFFLREGQDQLRIQDQFIDEDEKSKSFQIGASKRSVIAEDLFLDVNYNFETSNSRNTRIVYDAMNGEYTDVNNILSNDFEVHSYTHTPNAGINYEGETWRVDTELGLLSTTLKTDNYINDIAFDNTFNNIYVNTNVRYSLERSKSLRLGYRTNTNIPSVRQLQPVEDRTNPLNIVIGNPELRPTFNQRFDINFRNFDFATRSGIFANFNINLRDNQVATVSQINDDFVRSTTFTNVDGVINTNLGFNFSKSIKKDLKEFRYSLGVNGGYDRNVGFINGSKYISDQYSFSPNVRLTYAIDELFEINPSYSLSLSDIAYDINPNRNQSFVNHNIGLSATTYWPKNVVFGNDISYSYFGNVAPGFDNTSLLWNVSLGYQFLKDNATVKVKVYDLLDQNVDTRRLVGDDYVQDVNNLILTRYAMLSFTYKLSSFGGSSAPPNRRGGTRVIRM